MKEITEKYQLIREKYTFDDEPQSKDPLEVLIYNTYLSLKDTPIYNMPVVIENITEKVIRLSPNKEQGKKLFAHIINSVILIALEEGDNDLVARITDFTKILRQGLGVNKVGLNEGEPRKDEVKYSMKAPHDRAEPSPWHYYKYTGPDVRDHGVMVGPNGEEVEVDIADIKDIRDLKRRRFTWKK